jgi:UDP-2,3-diacylglucosamine hydrolase
MKQGPVYFASDFHLGIPTPEKSHQREALLIAWLDMVQQDASAIYLMGDLFDFWFEYKTAIPKGYARLLGKMAQITDKGIPLHLFRGNHDMWAFRYLQDEINVILHRAPEFTRLGNKYFYLAHGDGLGPGDHGYKFLKKTFACRFNQWLFRWLHPDIGIRMGLYWSRKSRYANQSKTQDEEQQTIKLIEQRLAVHSKEILHSHPELDYLVYGHYHYPLETTIGPHTKQVVLGDWLTNFSYGKFDGENLTLHRFPLQSR